MFECVYAQLVLPWYCVPEPREQQPLHQVLGREVDFIIDRIVEYGKDFDICQAVVGSIRILTQHLHNAKMPDRDPLFNSTAEEIAVLREFSDALVRNLFPRSLWGHGVNRCALNEIVALKGFGLLVKWLSDPDNLNQLVLSQLDSASPKGSVDDLCGSDPEQSSLGSEGKDDGEMGEVSSEGGEVSSSSGIKSRRKGNKLKQGWSKFVDKMKSKKVKKKKMKKMEQELIMRMIVNQDNGSNDDDVSSREGSIHSQQDSDREDIDLENYLTTVQEDMMEFKLSYEMWRVGRWAVSIPHADWEEDELTFTVHLEENNSPENLQWDIRKSYMEVIYFRNRWQDSTSLPSVLPLEESEVNDDVIEEVRVSVEHFLQELVSHNMIGHTQPVFQFLCPLDKLLNEEEHYEGVWGLLSGLAYLLTPGQEEEETSSPQAEVPKEITMPSSHTEFSAQPSENLGSSPENGADAPCAAVPTIIISQCDPSSEPPEEAAAECAVNPEPPSNEHSSQDKSEDSDNPLTSHFKMIFKGLTRSKSQESLASTKTSPDEEASNAESPLHCSLNPRSRRSSMEETQRPHLTTRSNKKEKLCLRMSAGANKPKGKELSALPKEEEVQGQRSQVDWEQLEATKAIFDLLKEISGNSILLNIFDAILKPVMPILKKKVNSFLNKMNPSEVQMAAYIDMLREKQWPESQTTAPPPPPRTEEEKNQTKERAHELINARYSNYLILKKTDMESVFNLFQDGEENKKLVYIILSFLLREFFPNEHSFNVSAAAAALQKVTNSTK
ncbi:uncharacterized protein LOC103390747 isoform X2 [Cynoglossus semilaevis]|uniref:uncharacterized protein LOC103390747 isoform X2 n=1 Tax=Cynoglossus semilaevis TaxID=244447 RepID=UPI0004979FFC|nr:uncharacterized protein LOC103390747 isoform X2 [Cynoglossus semilaevis]